MDFAQIDVPFGDGTKTLPEIVGMIKDGNEFTPEQSSKIMMKMAFVIGKLTGYDAAVDRGVQFVVSTKARLKLALMVAQYKYPSKISKEQCVEIFEGIMANLKEFPIRIYVPSDMMPSQLSWDDVDNQHMPWLLETDLNKFAKEHEISVANWKTFQ